MIAAVFDCVVYVQAVLHHVRDGTAVPPRGHGLTPRPGVEILVGRHRHRVTFDTRRTLAMCRQMSHVVALLTLALAPALALAQYAGNYDSGAFTKVAEEQQKQIQALQKEVEELRAVKKEL